MTHPVRAAIEARDIDALAALFADDIVFNSPVAFHPYVGRETVAEVLRNVMEVFTDFVYVDELVGDGTHGLVSEFTVLVRPLSGLVALAEAMGPRVVHLTKG